jgi:putative transposase
MSRLPRFFVPGLPAHLVHRGNNRVEIFRCEADYLYFRHCLQDRLRFGVRLHSYVLMTNHFHLLATPSATDSISRFIQSIARRYVGYFNARYERSGTLWEGRFHGSVIQSDRYLLACHRYIDMNPVRAGIAGSPDGYLWSSHGHYTGARPDSLVDAHGVIDGLAPDRSRRHQAYRQLFDCPLDTEELSTLRESLQLGQPTCEGGPLRRSIGRPPKKSGV